MGDDGLREPWDKNESTTKKLPMHFNKPVWSSIYPVHMEFFCDCRIGLADWQHNPAKSVEPSDLFPQSSPSECSGATFEKSSSGNVPWISFCKSCPWQAISMKKHEAKGIGIQRILLKHHPIHAVMCPSITLRNCVLSSFSALLNQHWLYRFFFPFSPSPKSLS